MSELDLQKLDALDALDALVAEHVMGWKVGDLLPYKNCGWFLADEKWTGYWTTESASRECPGFSPSTDIAAAWEVVELGRKETWFQLTYYHDYVGIDGPPYKAHWSCYWGDSSKENIGRGNNAKASTACLAICLAAMQSKSIFINEDDLKLRTLPMTTNVIK